MRVDPQLDTLLRFIVGITLAVTLLIIIVAVLYALIFVTQPIDAQAPNDLEFFKLITGQLKDENLVMFQESEEAPHGDKH